MTEVSKDIRQFAQRVAEGRVTEGDVALLNSCVEAVERLEACKRHSESCRALLHVPEDEVLYDAIVNVLGQLRDAKLRRQETVAMCMQLQAELNAFKGRHD